MFIYGKVLFRTPSWSPRLQHEKEKDGILFSHMSEENHSLSSLLRAFPRGVRGKELSQRHKRLGFHPRLRKIAWRKAWQQTPVFLPGKPHGQRSLVGYSPWGHRELDMTEST